jgi:hypothetical protein
LKRSGDPYGLYARATESGGLDSVESADTSVPPGISEKPLRFSPGVLPLPLSVKMVRSWRFGEDPKTPGRYVVSPSRLDESVVDHSNRTGLFIKDWVKNLSVRMADTETLANIWKQTLEIYCQWFLLSYPLGRRMSC